MTRRPLAALAVLMLPMLAFAACRGGGGGEKTPSPVPSATIPRTAAASPVPGTPTGEIRAVDLAAVPDIKQALADTGGEFERARVIYADLTGDGKEDAVVPIASGGTLGDVEFLVLAPAPGGGTTTLLKQKPTAGGGLAVAVEGDKLVMTEPVPGPDDPECCPSMLRKTTYAWDGTAFTVESVVTETNPAGGAKPTPSGLAPLDP